MEIYHFAAVYLEENSLVLVYLLKSCLEIVEQFDFQNWFLIKVIVASSRFNLSSAGGFTK